MYQDDHDGWLAPNLGRAFAQTASSTWVAGVLDFQPDNSDNTNTVRLRESMLYPYASSLEVFKCPADQSTAVIRGKTYPRVRSLAMNNWLGRYLPDGNRTEAPVSFAEDSAYQIRRKYTDLVDPAPSHTFVLIDEREDSINDCVFYIPLGLRNATAVMFNYPAAYHHRSAGLSFADGHAEIRKWKDPRTTPMLNKGQLLQLVPSPNNPDVAWLQERAAGRK